MTKFLPSIWRYVVNIMSNQWWRFCQFLRPSYKIWTLLHELCYQYLHTVVVLFFSFCDLSHTFNTFFMALKILQAWKISHDRLLISKTSVSFFVFCMYRVLIQSMPDWPVVSTICFVMKLSRFNSLGMTLMLT